MMGFLKPGKPRPAESADNSRRSFIWKVGAGASAALASAGGMARAETSQPDDLAMQVALLEEEKALRGV